MFYKTDFAVFVDWPQDPLNNNRRTVGKEESMNKFSAIALVFLLGTAFNANASTGSAILDLNGNNGSVILTGDAAKDLYSSLHVAAVPVGNHPHTGFLKVGRSYACSQSSASGSNVAQSYCVFTIDNVFTGSVISPSDSL